jgi:F-type H+-transporting ATPase subunit delta
MSELRIAKRYAQALMEQAQALDSLDVVRQDADLILQVLRENRALLLMSYNPEVNPSKKRTVFNKIFEGKVQRLTLLFIQLMVRKRRDGLLKEVMEEFVALYNSAKGISQAHLISARPVSQQTVDKIRDMVAKATQTRVELYTSEDQNLIGGFFLRYGDKLVDNSVRRRLRTLSQTFVNNR